MDESKTFPSVRDVVPGLERLFSFQYDDEYEHEYKKKLSLWNDKFYLLKLAKENHILLTEIDSFITDIFCDRELLRQNLDQLTINDCLYDGFQCLENYSMNIEKLEASKMKIYNPLRRQLSRLRLYALRYDNKKYIITGGAVKFTLKMKDHKDTLFELSRLSSCRKYLIDNNLDEDLIEDNLYD